MIKELFSIALFFLELTMGSAFIISFGWFISVCIGEVFLDKKGD